MNCYYEKFYDCLTEVVLDLVKPKMIFTLSGGLDTRLVAGVLAKNNANVPSIGYGNRSERMVSRRVAATLGLKHYDIPACFVQVAKNQFLFDSGFRYVMTAGVFFDEINGDWAGYRAKTKRDFELASKRCMDTALASFKKHSEMDLLKQVAPLLSPKLQAAFNEIPWHMRKGKQAQRYLLRTKFPQLWRILYYDSLLPPCLPFSIHSISDIVIHRNGEFIDNPVNFMGKLLK